MRFISRLSVCVLTLLALSGAQAQQNTISYNNQQLFLSGANLAWNNFARDIGPGDTDFDYFADVLLQIHDHGGNAMRLWLHTNGSSSPAFNDTGLVVNPGAGTVEDLKKILDLAWEREVGMKLCLWSFDMLRLSNDSSVLARNRLMLTDTVYAMAYINNSLIPMVDSLKGHPGIIAWEIFNEPELMTNEFGSGDVGHVPMADIQRFINLCAGAIHRTDPNALVTSGCWSFKAMSDISSIAKASDLSLLSYAEKQNLTESFNEKYRLSLSMDEVVEYLQKINAMTGMNYYSDNRLEAEGGDSLGVLDFYSVHYYAGLGSSTSPFKYDAAHWELDKPIVVAEFAMANTDLVLKADLFNYLILHSYAGALPWSWSDVNFSSHADMLAGMQYLWDNYKEAVDVNGISGDWPTIAIISPENDAKLPADTTVTITAVANDKDGTVALVEFYIDDEKVGEVSSGPYSYEWSGMANGIYKIYAVVTDNTGNTRASEKVTVQVGELTFVRLEAESQTRQGTGITIRSDNDASGGSYLQMATSTGTVTWHLSSVPKAGTYEVSFGYRLSYDRPKTQFVNVNGVRAAEVVFDSTINTWLEQPLTLDLIEGENDIQMELSWGWMDLDYLAVPSEIAIANEDITVIPVTYTLSQNYPNPFNPSTTINYSIAKTGKVKLAVYDMLGRLVTTLVDEAQNAGAHSVKFNGRALASGIYIYRLTAGNFTQSRQMVLIK